MGIYTYLCVHVFDPYKLRSKMCPFQVFLSSLRYFSKSQPLRGKTHYCPTLLSLLRGRTSVKLQTMFESVMKYTGNIMSGNKGILLVLHIGKPGY